MIGGRSRLYRQFGDLCVRNWCEHQKKRLGVVGQR